MQYLETLPRRGDAVCTVAVFSRRAAFSVLLDDDDLVQPDAEL